MSAAATFSVGATSNVSEGEDSISGDGPAEL